MIPLRMRKNRFDFIWNHRENVAATFNVSGGLLLSRTVL
jgi:hypothetical protein